MEITELLINRFYELRGGQRRMVVGVCGRAGAGKTTLTRKIVTEFDKRGIATVQYSGDWHFAHDSETRKKRLEQKWKAGLNAYMYALNQFSWWDFEKIFSDLKSLKEGRRIFVRNAYNRATGRKELNVRINPVQEGIICYENCVLGGVDLLESLDAIVLVNTDEKVCFERMLQKDALRRTVPEIAARYLITTYSENIFFKLLLENFSSKMVICNSDGQFAHFPEFQSVKYIPVPLYPQTSQFQQKKTIFFDSDILLDSEKRSKKGFNELKDLRRQGYHLVLISRRTYDQMTPIFEKLKKLGIEFDQIVSDLPMGAYYLMGSFQRFSKNGERKS